MVWKVSCFTLAHLLCTSLVHYFIELVLNFSINKKVGYELKLIDVSIKCDFDYKKKIYIKHVYVRLFH